MGNAAPVRRLTVDEYLEGELRAEIRHEYVSGEVFAMVGASKPHNQILFNLAGIIRPHLRGGPCRFWGAEIKVRIEAADVFYYPDVVVECEKHSKSDYFTEEPLLVIEILSPTTERIDRREKLVNYRRAPTLQEYVLIDQEKALVEIYRREGGDSWVREVVEGLAAEMRFASIGLDLTLAAVYEGIALT